MKKSLATIRAEERNYFQSPKWFCDFVEKPIQGLEREEGVHRRDPSSIIKVDNLYYVYYTKSYGPHVGFNTGDLNAKVFPWDYSEIWVATSEDGYVWEEKGVAVTRGEAGRYDDRSVFTVEVMKYDGKYYLVYQTVQHPYVNRSFENIAIAWSDNPLGPFQKSDEPILRPTGDGIWDTEEDNRFLVKKKGSFDSHKVHDPLLFHYRDKFYLYYKGEPMGEEIFMGGRETKWGVAIADSIEGPYIRSEYNPITNSGHETCLWQYKEGMAAFLRTDGVEKNTLQFAEDGINFQIMSVIKWGPEACGPYRPDEIITDDPLEGMKWGMSHSLGKPGCPYGCLVRFDINTKQRDIYAARKKYE
ncbi:glycoside hydrolase family 117 protein [Candidatus Epulonipiscium viviparus]|uniref:glycoside hydrolase family 117 protein n=1 Tax=Candidatus Epulonipiscium viviparus TaxID=420336 RepID=UPI00016C0F22|nr:family 43 glycosylhydrolase [Candidatus Epulopiscium viviparus]